MLKQQKLSKWRLLPVDGYDSYESSFLTLYHELKTTAFTAEGAGKPRTWRFDSGLRIAAWTLEPTFGAQVQKLVTLCLQ